MESLNLISDFILKLVACGFLISFVIWLLVIGREVIKHLND